jgi:hypothetical protein
MSNLVLTRLSSLSNYSCVNLLTLGTVAIFFAAQFLSFPNILAGIMLARLYILSI